MELQVTGRLTEITDPISGTSAKGDWTKQAVVIETDGEHPKKIAIMVWNNKPNISKLSIGETVTFFINIESREYNGNWFTDVKAWKYDADKSEAPKPQPQTKPQAQAETPKKDSNGKVDAPASTFNTPESDDLPF